MHRTKTPTPNLHEPWQMTRSLPTKKKITTHQHAALEYIIDIYDAPRWTKTISRSLSSALTRKT